MEAGQHGAHGHGDGVDLGGVADAEAGQRAQQGIGIGQPAPFPAQTVLNIVHGPAYVVAVLVPFPEMHGQCDLGKLGAHAQQRGYPHPEHRAGAADGDRPRHTGDIAGAHRGRQRRTHRLKRGQRALARLIVLENTAKCRLHGRAELAQLHKTGADAQVQAHAHQQDHGGNAPDKVIDRIVDAFNQCQHEIPLPCEISESNSTFLICRAAMLNPAQALEIQ